MSDTARIEGGIEWFKVPGRPIGTEEEDAMCARCGGSAEWAECCRCGGDGGVETDDGDLWNEDDYKRCPDCRGTGGSWHCISSPEHCHANPLPGREHIESTAMSSEAWSDCL